jgi:hypothetical protein
MARLTNRPVIGCIFCGNSPTTQEHVWPDWMRTLFSRTSHDKRFEILRGADGGVINRLHRSGLTIKKQIKCVCKPCNNGWMALLEQELKPTFLRLFYGRSCVISVGEQRLLARWLTMKMFVIEFDESSRSAVPQEIRTRFYKRRYIPRWTNISLFRVVDDIWEAALERHSIGQESPLDHIDLTRHQTITMGMGRLLFHLQYSVVPRSYMPFHRSVTYKIWPYPKRAVTWPPRLALKGRHASFVASDIPNIQAREPNWFS